MISEKYRHLWDEVAPRIDAGIEKHRKSDVTLKLVDRAGKPIAGKSVSIEQTSSAFLFGANLFMAGWFEGAANERYERAYADLFNAGTVALYWRDLEPTPGQLRFGRDSVKIRRRPPVDVSIDMGRRLGLNLSGHPLVWDFIKWSVPDWLSDADTSNPAIWERRIAQIAERYGDAIPRWDVCNETLLSANRVKAGTSRPMPPNYTRDSFRWAEAHLPRSAHLMINETDNAFYAFRESYPQLVRQLIDDGARVDGVGLQFHRFSDEANRKVASGENFTPDVFLATLDAVAECGRPIHISEITLASPKDGADGETLQAEVASNFYRLWFSHPAVHAITWWNFADGTAAPGEDGVLSGLLDPNLAPKPAYLALHDLIRKQWRTTLHATTDAAGEVRFRGFHGGYRATLDNQGAAFTLTTQGGPVTAMLGGEA